MRELDFLLMLNQYINSLNLVGTAGRTLVSKIGLLQTTESIAISASPGGAENVFYDGSRDKEYQVQISCKSLRQDVCMNALNNLSTKLENLSNLMSGNDSYEFQGINITSLPSLLGEDDKNYFIWVVSISAQLHIRKEVI